MNHKIIKQVLDRTKSAKEDSDFTYFFSLLLAAEAIVKLITLGMVSAIADDKDRNRYRLEHSLVKSDGLGDWGRVIEDALTGPASQYLLADARKEQAELTKLCRQGEWQYDSVQSLKEALDALGIESEEVPVKSDMKRWFRLFSTLRNKTRAHGATKPTKAHVAAGCIERSLYAVINNFSLFTRPCVYLHRNLSGKYRVSAITDDSTPFEFLKKEGAHALPNGVYVYFGMPRIVPLLQSDAELQDFFFSNGGFNAKKYELLSYFTDDKKIGDASIYSVPPGTLPSSETEGYGELVPVGNCFTNVPDLSRDYVERPKLEGELYELLIDDRRPIITLVGKGGIGKTSLSLQVIHKLYKDERYEAVIWLSSRDVDLQFSGPKPVRPFVLNPDDMSKLYAKLVLSTDKLKEKGFNPKEFFENQLQKNELGSVLYVFDNFETTQNPVEMFNWIDTYIRLPNKALITTRLRDFKGDYPIEVSGMEESESRTLVEQTALQLGVRKLLNDQYVDELIARSEGHPYVMKVLLGEVAKAGKAMDVKRIVAGSDEILTALFERTYSSLTPCSQRAFMTLAAWNSAVPRIALEAVLMRSITERDQIENGIESLVQFSMAESYISQNDNQEFISIPLVASVFGKKKLNVSPFKTAIQIDVETLQMLGTSRKDDLHLGLAKRLEKFIGNISQRIDSGDSFSNYSSILDMICRAYNPGWLILARWHLESGTQEDVELAKKELRRFLENDPAGENAAEAWQMLGNACYQTGDALGEVHAFIERAQISSVPFYDVSNTANRLNRLLREHELEVDIEEKRLLAQRIADVLDARRSEADADDYSRMAWLNLHLGREQKAKEYAEYGLTIEPDNQHCQKILERIANFV